MVRKILSLILVIALCFTVCACGGNGDDNNNVDGTVNDNVSMDGGENTQGGNDNQNGSSGNGGSGASTPSGNGGSGGGSGSSGGSTTTPTFKPSANNPKVMGLFYRNVVGQNFNINNASVKEVDKKADAMLKKIEDYPDTVKAKSGGKTYYISNKGSDSNNGLSAKTARATYASISNNLKPGDCVLFERGSLWRGQMLLKEGVSYGAYGSGIKPRFYGSVDGSKNGGGKWTATSTKGVYSFSKVINNYSNLVLDNGAAIGRPVKNMDDITERELNAYYKLGKVYLYCPYGNPADVFSSIEIVEGYSEISCKETCNNIRIQNFCIMYAGLHGISPGQTSNFEIEGCVVGYIGGKDLYLGGYSIGNGMEFWGNVKNLKVHDNYVFQCYDAGITHQSNDVMNYNAIEEDIYYTNNLVEYCVYSFEAFVSKEHGPNKEYHDRMGKVTISDNISRFAGWGWGYLDRPDKGVPADLKYAAVNHTDTLLITNNIFDRSKLGVYRGNTAKKEFMVFTNNTILINPKRTFMDFRTDGKVNMGDDINAFMKKIFKDSSGTKVIEVPNS